MYITIVLYSIFFQDAGTSKKSKKSQSRQMLKSASPEDLALWLKEGTGLAGRLGGNLIFF